MPDTKSLLNAGRIGRLVSGLCWGLGLLTAVHSAQANAPRTPTRDQEVVEVLRDRPLTEAERRWRTLREQLRQQPRQAALAAEASQLALSLAQRDGDPRWLGQAQAVLAPWWSQPTPPPSVRLLRAMLLQSTHQFDAALRDLQALTQLPVSAHWQARDRDQAWLVQAAVLQVTARYDEAAQACAALTQGERATWGRACQLELQSLRGQAPQAYDALGQLASTLPSSAPVHGQVGVMRAELAERLGRADHAERLYRVLSAQSDDAYLLGAYADFLLDQGRAAEVMSLLQGRERNDALLLRLAEAGMALGDAANRARVSALKARFDAARLRGDRVHLREEARFTLRLLRQPAQALRLAQRNWQVQKEPADARILLEAAAASQQPHEATLVKAAIRQWGWQDQRLEKWL